MTEEEGNPKNELHKLLKEYEANRGMAGMVCSIPVGLMPKEEQDRIFHGFCTEQNLKILASSREKLLLARNLELTEIESGKIDTAVHTLGLLLEAFHDFVDSNIDKEVLCEKVRTLLEAPIPDNL